MNDAPTPLAVPVDVAERIHRTCDRFEDAWSGPTRPRLGFFLATVAEPERSWLLEELVALEVELRRAAGEQPTEAGYRQAYPGEADGKVIAAAFRRCAEVDGESVRTLPVASGDATTATLRLRSLDNAAAPVIEGYVILGILGRGGMGTVFLAEDNRLGRKVAIKTMRPELAVKAENRVRFLREARVAAAIEHDNVVPIWQVGQATDGSPFIVMPFLQGETLESRLKREPVQPLGLLLQMAREMAEALAASHARGLTHRDIKPANIWVEGDPDATELGKQVRRCKILDFGLAQAANEDVQLTQRGAIVGTPAYIAPEQARGETVDHRCDLFSLGCVLYRLATGKRPFKGDTTMAVLLSLAADTPQSVCELNPNLPPRLVQLTAALLAKRPTERPASASVVIAEIEAIQRELASPTPVPERGRSPGDEATLEVAQPVPAVAPKKPSRRPQVAVALGLLALVAAVVFGVVLLMQTPDGKVVRIECDDPDIKVAFEKGEFKVTGAYKEPLILKPGQIGLKVKKGEDFEFETDKLIVQKGDRIALKIEVVAGKVQIVQEGKGVLDAKELPVVKGDLDRRAAEYVLSIGGTIWVRGNDLERNITAVAGLPKENFLLTQVHLWENKQVSDAGLAVFKDCKNLTYLDLRMTNVTAKGLADFRATVPGCKIEHGGVANAQAQELSGSYHIQAKIHGGKSDNDRPYMHILASGGMSQLIASKDYTRTTFELTKVGRDNRTDLYHIKQYDGQYLIVTNGKVVGDGKQPAKDSQRWMVTQVGNAWSINFYDDDTLGANALSLASTDNGQTVAPPQAEGRYTIALARDNAGGRGNTHQLWDLRKQSAR